MYMYVHARLLYARSSTGHGTWGMDDDAAMMDDERLMGMGMCDGEKKMKA